jgi:LPS export ABC transporter protein LptC
MPRLPRGPAPALVTVALLAALAAARPAAAVDLVLSEMTYVGSEAGEPGVVLEAERARIEHGADLAHLEGVRLDAAGEDGSASLKLTCDRALLNLATSDFTAEGNVRGYTADGHRFKTELAEFRHDARVIEGNAPVDILDPIGTRLEGSGFRYDVRRQRMKMSDAVVSENTEPFE